jgi:putative flippase GtrA
MMLQYLSHSTVFIKNDIFTHKADIGSHATAKFTNIYNLGQNIGNSLNIIYLFMVYLILLLVIHSVRIIK